MNSPHKGPATRKLFPFNDVILSRVSSAGAYRCFPVPIFHSPFVHKSLCFPVPIFPSPFLPPWGTPYVSQSLCFPIPLLPSPYVLQPLYSPVSIFPINGFPSLCSPNIFPSPHVPVDFLFPRPDLSRNCFQSQFSPKMSPSPYVPHKCFHSLCSPKIFPSPYVSQSLCSAVPICSPIPMLPSPYRVDVPQCLCSSNMFPSPDVPQSQQPVHQSYVPQSLSFGIQ